MNHIFELFAQVSSFKSTDFNIEQELETQISNISFDAVQWGGIILVVLLILSTVLRDRMPKLKTPLFVLICFDIVAVTLLLIGSTIYLNVNSESGGPVHWHTDFEIRACGQEVEFRDPVGVLSNKIGISTLHEHNDKRIHLEGVVVEETDASLAKFFHVTDGYIDDTQLQVPVNAVTDGSPAVEQIFEDETYGPIDTTVQQDVIEDNLVVTKNDGTVLQFRNGQTCPDGTLSEVQVFAYEVGRNQDGSYETRVDEGKEKKVFYQRKVENPREFIINHESTVPDGDCLIIEFAPTKTSTDFLCEQYQVKDTGRTLTNEDGTTRESLADYVYGGVRSDEGGEL